MRFESPIYLWLLVVIPIFFGIMVMSEWRRNKNIKLLGDKQLIKALMPDASRKRRWTKFILLQVALMLFVLVLARPQMGAKIANEKRNGIEAIICLDISNSMLAEDVQPNRLQKSKMLVENMVDKFVNDKIGLIVFAGDAFVQLPITSDFVSAKMFLQNAEPSLIQTQGTDIAHAIELAENSFTQQKNIGRAIIVITDGEDHEGGALEAAKEAKKKGMNVFILGVGNTGGAPIPSGNGYMTDNTGQTVMTALNEQMCREIASAGQGTYIHVDNTTSAQETLNNELAKLQKGDMESLVYSEYNEQFQAFGLLAIIVLILEICINEASNPYLKRIRIFRRKNKKANADIAMKSGMLLIMLCFGASMMAQTDRNLIRQGNRSFRSGDVPNAEVAYRKSMAKNPNNAQAVYNLGCALQAQQKDSAAVVQYEKAASMETNKLRKAKSYHNIGVICQKNLLYDEAIEAYKQALRLDPGNDQTRYNLVLCQRQKKNNNQNNQQNQQDQDNKDNKDKDKQKQEQNQDQQDKNQDQQKKEQPKEQMSKENAEALLKAAQQDEKNTQQRLKKAMAQPQRRNLQKNW